MPEAVLKGEAHLSKKDMQALMEIDLTQFDAVCMEHHEKDYFERPLTTGYVLFLIGHLIYGATFGRVYVPHDEFREKAAHTQVPVHDVDVDVSDAFEMVPYWKRVLFLPLAPVGALMLLGLIVGGIQWTFSFLPRIAVNLMLSVFAALSFGFLWAFFYFRLIEGDIMPDRDEYMANSLMSAADDEGYERVLLACGDKHLAGINEILEEAGWTVEQRPSESIWSKVLRIPSRVLSAVLNPHRTINRHISRGRTLLDW